MSGIVLSFDTVVQRCYSAVITSKMFQINLKLGQLLLSTCFINTNCLWKTKLHLTKWWLETWQSKCSLLSTYNMRAWETTIRPPCKQLKQRRRRRGKSRRRRRRSVKQCSSVQLDAGESNVSLHYHNCPPADLERCGVRGQVKTEEWQNTTRENIMTVLSTHTLQL